MKRNTLQHADLELSVVGLGTWAIGGDSWRFGWGPQDDQAAIDTICRAVEVGINWVDTAAVYGSGTSEELVGRALQKMPASRRPLIATKCSRVVLPDGSVGGVLKRESILREIDDSLRRLGVEVIDLYQIHWPIPDEDVEEAWQTLVDIKQAGKVRAIGVSNFNASQLERVYAIHPVATLQPPYSMVARDVERETLPYCREHGIGVIVYSPMHKGLLTGKFTPEKVQQLAESDHRRELDPRFQSPQLGVHLKLVENLRPIAERVGCTLAQLAIAWTWLNPAVTAAIVGARSPEQIEDTAAAARVQLSDQDVAEMQKHLETHAAKLAQS
ncbi:MAG: aldo/keto reductase [Planctomycetales bacterium]|nr:aldo/keto reductase [Planctomycetales bacterium]